MLPDSHVICLSNVCLWQVKVFTWAEMCCLSSLLILLMDLHLLRFTVFACFDRNATFLIPSQTHKWIALHTIWPVPLSPSEHPPVVPEDGAPVLTPGSGVVRPHERVQVEPHHPDSQRRPRGPSRPEKAWDAAWRARDQGEGPPCLSVKRWNINLLTVSPQVTNMLIKMENTPVEDWIHLHTHTNINTTKHTYFNNNINKNTCADTERAGPCNMYTQAPMDVYVQTHLYIHACAQMCTQTHLHLHTPAHQHLQCHLYTHLFKHTCTLTHANKHTPAR